MDSGSLIRGELHFDDEFRVEGQIHGHVISNGRLIVGDKGEIDGEVQAREVIISGTVKGQVQTTEKVEITATGRVFANLFTPSLIIEEGAYFEGSCAMNRGAAKTPKSSGKDGVPKGTVQDNVTKLPINKRS